MNLMCDFQIKFRTARIRKHFQVITANGQLTPNGQLVPANSDYIYVIERAFDEGKSNAL
jgi:hypothetical protein